MHLLGKFEATTHMRPVVVSSTAINPPNSIKLQTPLFFLRIQTPFSPAAGD
jgi:hypothetical protein